MAQTTKKKPQKRKKKKKQALDPRKVVLLLLAALILCSLILIKLLQEDSTQDSALSSDTVQDMVPSPLPTLPPSTRSAECFGFENGYKSYVTDSGSAELGLDISSHQGWIDWNAVAQTEVDYVILRAGYRGYGSGDIHQDEYLEYNLASASATDLGVGIYFFSQAITEAEAIEEANMILSLIEGYEIDYPIFFDWEPIDDPAARTATISMTELTACAKAFCQTIEDAGYEAGVYFNLAMASGFYHLYELKDYEFWLAEYQETPSFPFEIDMWQYSCEGTVNGIATTVDLNLSFTSYEA